jgi:hypothetical protein
MLNLLPYIIAIHAVRSEDVRYQLTDMLIEDIETPTTADAALQKIKEDSQKWSNPIKQKSSANGIRLRTALVIGSTEISDIVHCSYNIKNHENLF